MKLRTKEEIIAELLPDDELAEQVNEELAERAHDLWMERERAQGNADNPDMVPYEKLPEIDKEMDRDYSRSFFELLDENGYDIVEKEAASMEHPDIDDMIRKFDEYLKGIGMIVIEAAPMSAPSDTGHAGAMVRWRHPEKGEQDWKMLLVLWGPGMDGWTIGDTYGRVMYEGELESYALQAWQNAADKLKENWGG